MRSFLIWAVLAIALVTPMLLAAQSPLLQWRTPVYILAGLAGVFALALMLLQPLLVAGWAPGLHPRLARSAHRWIGGTLILAVVLHVGGLFVTSPPDVIDALTFTSPTPFSNWGVIAMWTAFAAAILAFCRGRLTTTIWRVGHSLLVSVTVLGSIVHVLLVEGTMEVFSKIGLCLLVALATVGAISRLKAWRAIRLR